MLMTGMVRAAKAVTDGEVIAVMVVGIVMVTVVISRDFYRGRAV